MGPHVFEDFSKKETTKHYISRVVHSESNSVPKEPKTMLHGPRGQSRANLAIDDEYVKDIGNTSVKLNAIASMIPELILGNTPKRKHF